MLSRSSVVAWILVVILSPGVAGAQSGESAGFLETFALADDRGAVLDQLVAGTEEHFYYSCLHFQQQGDLDAVDRLMEQWEQSAHRSRLPQIQYRQALLRSSTNPEATYAFLEGKLGVQFNDRRVVRGVSPDLPTEFDNAYIDRDRLVNELLRQPGTSGVTSLSGPVLESLVRMDLTQQQRSELLRRLERPDVPGLVELLASEIRERSKTRFGSRAIDSKLLLDQLEALRRRLPGLLSNQAYVKAVLLRLAPDVGESLEDPSVRVAYLDRAIAFAEGLPDTFNSLKAQLLYHRLALDLEREQPNRARFMRYLQLPRNANYLDPGRRRHRSAANLNESFDGVPKLSAVGDDRELVSDLLQALLRDADSYDGFLQVLPENFVRRAWAEAKLLYSEVDDAESLIGMLGGPGAAERLKERVEVEFASTNPVVFGPKDEVVLAVDLKNVESLLVKVFKIDAVGYFDESGAAVSGSLDLQGLVPNAEKLLSIDQPPLRRVRKNLDLPELSGPGTFLVELIGNGVSSRALVRKGALHMLERVGAAGHVLRVLDHERVHVSSAIVRFGGRDYEPDARGEIHIPFTPRPGRKFVLLRAGGVASVASFHHSGESYALDVAVHVPSEALLPGQSAPLVVRPRLSLNGEPVSLKLLEGAALTVTAVDLDGTESTEVFDDLDLDAAEGLVQRIQVPERLASVGVRLTGTVRNLSEAEDVALSSPVRSTAVNSAARTTNIAQSFLTRVPTGYAIDLLGRNGEPLSDREVTVGVRTQFINKTVRRRLKTDASGRVRLGALLHVESVSVSGPAGAEQTWELADVGTLGLPREIRGLAGLAVRVPVAEQSGAVTREMVSLIQYRGDWPLRDRFDAVAREPGSLVLRDLDPGVYRLTLKSTGESYGVRVIEGDARFGHIVGERSAFAGISPVPLTIRSVVANAAGGDEPEGEASPPVLRVELGGASPAARLHVFATRFEDPYNPHVRLASGGRSDLGWTTFSSLPSSYESGLSISDEYRYILERRLLDIYPGNMLPRAGVLLNPWVVRETSSRMAGQGGAGQAYGKRAGTGKGRMGGGAAGRSVRESVSSQPDLSFLANAATVLAGLTPDADGVVTIPLADLGPNHMIQLVAVDDRIAVSRNWTRAEVPLELRERRLVDSLDPGKPMTQQRRIEFLRAGETLDILDAPNANARTFDTVSDVFRLYRTMSGDAEFSKFEFVTRWPTLESAEKRDLYSRYVCHELNVFLREKDPEFFDAVVAPYLANKEHRTFLDDWLLGSELESYLEPWQFERLNIVEKVLLLRRTGGQPAQYARDAYALVPRGVFSLDRAFGAVLASGGLSSGGGTLAGALEMSRKKAAAESAPRQAGGPSSTGVPTPSAEHLRSLGYAGDEGGGDSFFLGQGNKGDESVFDAPGRLESEGLLEEVMESMDDAEASREGDVAKRRAVRAFFRELGLTEEFAETHYWRTSLDRMDERLITVSPFWVDFAASSDGFTSAAFPLATRSHTEMLLALAFLDLPFEAREHTVVSESRSVQMTAASPLFVALEDVGAATQPEGASSVLVGQNYFRLDDRTETVDGLEREKFVNGEILAGVPYGCRMVLTNPSSAQLDCQALVQIPAGAIALGGTRVTHGHPLRLQSYGTTALETLFYFPEAGTFRDYPVHAGRGSALLGAAQPTSLVVVEQLSAEETDSWSWISQNADLAGVVAHLERANPHALDLGKVAWRAQERESFEALTTALERRNVFEPSIWKYALKHRDNARTREYLSAEPRLEILVEAPFSSPLLTLDPERRKTYEHLAYEPLINGRVHSFGGERRLLDQQFAAQYRSFLRVLALQRGIDDWESLELTYYLLLQDRVGEALNVFGRIDRNQLSAEIQYDYMLAYTDFYRGDTERARTVATHYINHPVARWRERFGAVLDQLDEIEGARSGTRVQTPDAGGGQDALAGTEPVLELAVDAGRVSLTHERLASVEVRYHLMDVELLFSTNPFVRGGSNAFGIIEPNEKVLVSLDTSERRTSFAIPEIYRRANLFIEVRGGGIARHATYFAGSLSVQGMERFGQLRVVEGADATPLSRAYVKVYARLSDGQVRFHKDGYTDLRGRFDYVSVSGWDGASVERYSVLAVHPESGATIAELAPPE